MSIKMNELAQETRVKFQEAIADGRITAEEWKNFSKEEQEVLSKGLGGKTPTVGDDVVIKTTKKAPEAKKQERADLSWGEIGKQGLKSVGNFFKGMVCDEEGLSLTRTAITVGTAVAFAALTSVSSPVALAVGTVLGGYMVYGGTKRVIEGTKEYHKATTHEEAVASMEKTMYGGIEIAGGVAALFGVKNGYTKYKAAKAQPKPKTPQSVQESVLPKIGVEKTPDGKLLRMVRESEEGLFEYIDKNGLRQNRNYKSGEWGVRIKIHDYKGAPIEKGYKGEGIVNIIIDNLGNKKGTLFDPQFKQTRNLTPEEINIYLAQ